MKRRESNRASALRVAFLAGLVLAFTVGVGDRPQAAPRGGPSQASLNVSTAGCETDMADPTWGEETSWTLEKMADPDDANNFIVTVTEGETRTMLRGTGTLRITNSGEQVPWLENVVVNLEESGQHGDAPGPSGKNWHVRGTAVATRSAGCAAPPTCYQPEGAEPSDGSSLVILSEEGDDLTSMGYLGDVAIPASVDDDGDGVRDEDPANGIDDDQDGSESGTGYDCNDLIDNDLDGLTDAEDPDCFNFIDEDDACDEAMRVLSFEYAFDITDLVADGTLAEGDDLRINVMVTFGGAGDRGKGAASCAIDLNCNGVEDPDDPATPMLNEWEGDWSDYEDYGRGDNVRTVQQRHPFTLGPQVDSCQTVHLVDPGAFTDSECGVVNPTGTLDEIIARGDGQQTFDVPFSLVCAAFCDVLGEVDTELEEAEGDDGVANMRCYHPGTRPESPDPSYWDCQITNGGALNGWYDGWCVDADTQMSSGTLYTVELKSSYDPASFGLVEWPQNLDRVNWLLNNYHVGDVIPGGTVSYGDLQRSIWGMVEDANHAVAGDSVTRVNFLVLEACGVANVEGLPGDVVNQECPVDHPNEGYEAPCGGSVSVMVIPVNAAGATAGQINILPMQLGTDIVLDCEDCAAAEICTPLVENVATLDCEDGSALVVGSPASASTYGQCAGVEPGLGLPLGTFTTYTQGGWGAPPNGGNPGALLEANWSDVFSAPDWALIGGSPWMASDGERSARWTTAHAVELYLPAGGTGKILGNSDFNNPTNLQAGVFGGQLLAATINVAFDDAGLLGTHDGTMRLGDLVYVDCVAAELLGATVDEVLAWAHDVIGRGSNDVPAGVGLVDLQSALDVLNNNFDNGANDLGCLALP